MNALPRDWAALGPRVTGWTPPAGAFEPAGAWLQEFTRHSLIPSPDGSAGGGIAGALSVRRNPSGGAVRLEVVESVATGSATLTSKAGIDDGPAPWLTPQRWSLDIRWDTRAPARAEPGEMDQQRAGRVEGGTIILGSAAGGPTSVSAASTARKEPGPAPGPAAGTGARERRIPAPARWTSSWSLFAAVPLLPFEAGAPLEFDLLEDLELLKPGQRIVYAGRHGVPLAGGALTLHVFEQTGRGVMPWRWWLDDAHRILLAAGGRRAYLAGAPARKGAAA